MKKPTLTIGIPAFNEAENIEHLLGTLLAQKIVSAKLEKIIVVSDGSTDDTKKVASSVQSPLITVIERKERFGTHKTLNQIMRASKSDILVLLNADILPTSISFIETLILPIIKNKKVGLVGGDVVAAKPTGAFEKIMVHSHNLKMFIGKRIHNGRNVYMCYGGNRAFSKSFYETLHFPEEFPEDAFSYFECIRRGFSFVYCKDAKVIVKLPSTYNDHKKQSTRFSAGKKNLEVNYGASMIDQGYHIPIREYLVAIAYFFIKNPVLTMLYLGMTYIFRNTARKVVFIAKWEPSKSTKHLTL